MGVRLGLMRCWQGMGEFEQLFEAASDLRDQILIAMEQRENYINIPVSRTSNTGQCVCECECECD